MQSYRRCRLHRGQFGGQELRRGLDAHLQPQPHPRRARGLRGQAGRGLRSAEPARGRDRPVGAAGLRGHRKVRRPARETGQLGRGRQRRFRRPWRGAPRKPELERDAEPDLAERLAQHQDGLLVHRSQAHPVEHLPAVQLQRRADAQPVGRTAPACRWRRPCWVSPTISRPNCPPRTGGLCSSSTRRGRPTCRTSGSCAATSR